MNEFHGLMEQVKFLYESGLYEDVKIFSDMLLAWSESPSLASACSPSAPSATTPSQSASSAMITDDSIMPSTSSTTQHSQSTSSSQTTASNSKSTSTCWHLSGPVDLKDKYMLYYWYANAAFNLREFKLAETLFNKALSMNKSSTSGRSKSKSLSSLDSDTDIQIKFNLYLCLLYDKKYQEAFSLLDSIPSKQRSVKILLAMAKLSQLLMNTKDAISFYKEVLKTSKFSMVAVEALLNLGVKLDDLPKLPSNINADWLNTVLKAKNQVITRDFKDAIKCVKGLDTNLTHRSTELLSLLGHAQYLNGEYSNAISSFEKLHKLEPTHTAKMDIYAFLLFSDKTENDKLSTLEKLANDMHQVSVNIPETWIAIGYYSLKKKSQKAKCFAENALLIDPENSQALLLRAIALAKLKAITECACTYREATRINPYFYEAYKGLVETLLNLNHTKDAVQIATTAIKLLGSNHRTLALYGEALSRDSSTQEKSKTYLYKAIKGDPDNQEAMICLVRVCMTLQQFNEALEVLGKYIRHNQSNSRLLHIYSELMKKCGRSDDAVLYMNKASGMDPNNAQIKSMLEKTEQSIETTQDETIQNFHVI